MRKYKTEHHVYAAWDYEKELAHLDEMSRQGWQLIRGGCFHSRFVRNEHVLYRYQLDFRADIDDQMRYRETFREQGWEYINSTFNGWHYFRKPYDAKLPENEYQIYTDRPSRQEMAGRQGRIILGLGILMIVFLILATLCMIFDFKMAMLGIVFEMLVGATLAGMGVYQMRAASKGRQSTWKTPVSVMIPLMVLGLAWFIVFAVGHVDIAVTSQNAEGRIEVPFEVRLPDWVELSVGSETGKVLSAGIYTTDGAEKLILAEEETRAKVFLTPGEYIVRSEWTPEEAAVSVELN